MSEPDDTVFLLQRWHAGHEPALHDLLDRHLPELHRFVSKVLSGAFAGLRREQESLDVVHDCAAKVLAYLPRFVPRDGEQFQALLRTFVRNELRNRMRSPRRKSELPVSDSIVYLNPAGHSSEYPERVAARAEEVALVRLALEFLPEEDRRLLQQHLIEDKPWDEIARELGLESADAARMQYKRRAQPRLANVLRLLKAGRVDELL